MKKKIIILMTLILGLITANAQNPASFPDGINAKGILQSINASFGESYINNYRDRVLDKGATYFPNHGGYDYGLLAELGLERDMSLMMIPSAVAADSLYLVKGSPNFTHARNSTATYVNENGIISIAPIDTPRIDYTSGDGVLLNEDQSTNLAIWSEEFSDTQWITSQSTITSDATLSPSGDLADKLIATSNSSTLHAISDLILLTENEVHTFSVFFKKGEYNFGQLRFNSSSTDGCIFDLENGIIGNKGANVTAEIVPFSNGWYRCSISKTLTAANNNFRIVLNETNDFNAWTGDDVSGIFISNAQVEVGGITSYIPTAGSTVTRLADSTFGAGNVNIFNSLEGTLFVEIAAFEGDLFNRSISITDGTINNRIHIFYDTTLNEINASSNVAGAAQSQLKHVVTDITDFHKVVFKYKLNDFALWIDGIEVDVDVSGLVWDEDILQTLSLDFDINRTNPFRGRIKPIIYFKRALTDNEIQLLMR